MRDPIWRPSAERILNSNLTSYQRFLIETRNLRFSSFEELYNWSIRDITEFWKSIWEFSKVVHSVNYDRVNGGEHMWGNKWFTGARLNYAENLLRFNDDRTAIIHWNETGKKGRVSYRELHKLVAACAAGLKDAGVRKGDRVAAYITNIPEAVIMMLATTSIGAIWSSCSPDFGMQGVLDRFQQIEPKVLLGITRYHYQGKSIDRTEMLKKIADHLPSLNKVVVVSGTDILASRLGDKFATWEQFKDNGVETIEFEQLEFDHPIYILYSSGTTGVPKCIAHGAGGTLLQHYKEHALHTDLHPGDVISYFTTCGWMMWNWLVGALFQGAAVFLYDGSPAHPDLNILWDAVDEEKINIFGTSPKFLHACEQADLITRNTHHLNSLRTILSTGSPLPASSFEWVYLKLKSDVQLASISGGTDIVSCFMLGCPTIPVYRGEIQTRGLGMRVETYDERGKTIKDEVGELVCTAPFPSRPVYFWNDSDGSKYRSAYYEHFPGVWRHGDFIKITETGGVIVYGRSDATLNRAGVRIGTAEIYSPVEAMPEVEDSLVVEHRTTHGSEIILFIVTTPGTNLSPDLKDKIRSRLREDESPRHVPDKIFQIREVPRTVSGKKVELAVARLLNGDPVTNQDALVNPESLRQFEAVRDELQSKSDRT